MEIINAFDQKLKLSYPCLWSYRVIGQEIEATKRAILETIGERTHKISYTRSSRKGKYHSFNLTLLVTSDEERTALFMALKNHQAITMVL